MYLSRMPNNSKLIERYILEEVCNCK
jgi:hypothetical protein